MAIALAASLALTPGCSSGEDDDSTAPSSPRASSTAPADPPPSTELPTGRLGKQAAWVLDRVGPDEEVPAAEARRRFAPEFLAELPPAQVEGTFAQVRELAPFTVVEVAPEAQQGELRAVAVRLRGAEALVMELAIDQRGRIAGLRFRPDPAATPPASYDSLDEMVEDLEELGEVQVYAARLEGGACAPTHQQPEDAPPAPSGSVFKLVVLSAVVDAVADGELEWDDELTVSAAVKSLPSGVLQDRADGSRVSVRRAAELMIARSDNTATDLLMGALTRGRLAGVVGELGLSHASMHPVLTTREFFLLGWGDRDVAWADTEADERRRLLDRLPRGLGGLEPQDVDSPAWSRGVDWFLSGEEVCRVYAALHAQAQTEAGGPVLEILRPPHPVRGLEDVDLGFKGGSAPGVVALTYLLDPAGERPEVLVVQVRSESDPVDEQSVFAATEGGLGVVAADRR